MIIYPVLVPIPQDSPLRTPERVRQQCESARLALGESARRCGAPEDGWVKDGQDVPLPQAGYYWSVSHKRKWAAAVIADRPVGIDIEHIAPRRDEMFKEVAGEDEWTLMGGHSWAAFFRVWTAKEAILKATGIGIAGFHACHVVGTADERHLTLEYENRLWQVEQYYHDDHIVAVTVEADAVSWHVVE